MLAMTICKMPRGMSYARTNGGAWCRSQPSQDSAESPDDGFALASRDVGVAMTKVLLLSLLESAIWALYNRVHEQNDWAKKVSEDEPHAPMFLHDSPHRDQPPLKKREHKKPDAGSGHRSRIVRRPAEEPEIVADSEVEIHEHVSYVHGHSLVHVHIHAIIVGESTRNQ